MVIGIFTFALLGIGSGGAFAGLALGLVFMYKSTGVVNFALGAVAGWALLTYTQVRNTGVLILPVFRVTVGNGSTSPVVAVLLGVAVAATLALLMYLLVFRFLRNAPVLARVVASVGLAVTLSALLALRFGTDPLAPQSVFPTKAVHIGSVHVAQAQLWILGCVVVAVVVLEVVSRKTRFGLVTRASAESEPFTQLLGYSANRISVLNWTLAGAITGLFAILAATVTGANAGTYDALLVPALGAMLIAGLDSLWIAGLAGVLFGVLQSLLTYANSQPWMPEALGVGNQQAVPFIVIAVVLFVRGTSLPTRRENITGRLPRAPKVAHPVQKLIVSGVLLVGCMLVLRHEMRLALIVSLITAVLLLSLVVLTGYTGQITLAQSAMSGIGAFASTRIGTDVGLPFWGSAILAVLVAGVVGIIVGLPTLRIRGTNLALVTLAGAVAVQGFIFSNKFFTGGQNAGVASPLHLFGLDLGILGGASYPRAAFGIFVVIVFLAVAGAVLGVRNSVFGTRLIATRDNERAAAAVGLNVKRLKLVGVLISALIAGVAGVLLAEQQVNISAESFSINAGLALLVFAYLGGITSVSGAFIGGLLASGGLIFVAIGEVWNLGQYAALIGGLGVVLTTILNPDGISGELRNQRRALWAKVRGRSASENPSAAQPGSARRGGPGEETAPVMRQRPARTPGKELLKVSDVTVTYGVVKAVDRMSLVVYPGEIVGLIGSNGAGKTTLVDAITGHVESRGTMLFGGEDISRLSAHRRAGRGLLRTFQTLELFGELTVADNVSVCAPRGPESAARVDEALAMFGLTQVRERFPRELSLADERLLGMSRVVAASPRLIVLDEPAAGLDLHEREQLGRTLQQISQSGVAILLIEHDTDLVFKTCDYVYAMSNGAPLDDGTSEAVRQSPAVRAAYLGEELVVAGSATAQGAVDVGE